MKNMNRKEGKKIAVMAAVIMGLMMFAFMPFASATVTSFTVTPSTGLAGAVDSYNALVTTDGVTTINITIPAGFIGVVPMSGGVELARIDFWNSSTKAYYGYATFTANDTNPTTKIDAYFELGGVTARTTQDVNYNPGATNTFVSHVGGDTSSVITKLPTETVNGSINITINCMAFYLDDVMFAIKQFVRNPTTAGDYVFSAEGVDETVTITALRGRGIIFRNGQWFVDSNGDHICDQYFWYGMVGDTPLVGDVNQDGKDDTIIFKNGQWFVDTDGDHVCDLYFWYGMVGDTPLVGDVNQDGKDDTIIFKNGQWFVDTDGDHVCDLYFWYGMVGDTPLVGDVNQDGKDDTVIFKNGQWFVDTTKSHTCDLYFWYGMVGDTPLVGDVNLDGKDDTIIFRNGQWFVDTTKSHTCDLYYWYGMVGDTPLVGDIG